MDPHLLSVSEESKAGFCFLFLFCILKGRENWATHVRKKLSGPVCQVNLKSGGTLNI